MSAADADGAARRAAVFDAAAPWSFVAIWSTGWIAARYGAAYADPLTFLVVRFSGAFLAMGAIALATHATWPRDRATIANALLNGALIHALYLGGVWTAVRHGLPASISALLAATQPLATAALAPRLLGERLTGRARAGVALGFVGLLATLWPQLASLGAGALRGALGAVAINLLGMAGVTAGAFHQKRFLATGDLRAIATLQYAGAILVTLPAAAALEPMRIEWNATMAAVLAWSVLALSVGAIMLMLTLIRHGAVTRQAQLIFLVPPTAAFQAWLLFGERLAPLQIAGMAVTAAGVAMATRRAKG